MVTPRAGLLGLLLACACAPHDTAVPVAQRQWPLPDGACAPASNAGDGDDGWQSRRWEGLTFDAWLELSRHGRWPHDFEALTWLAQAQRERVRGLEFGTPIAPTLAEVRGIRAAIDRIEAAQPEAVLDAAIALHTPAELSTPLLGALAQVPEATPRLTAALACELPQMAFADPLRRMPDPRALQAVASWPSWRVQLRVIAMLRERGADGDGAVLDTLAQSHWSLVVRTAAVRSLEEVTALARAGQHGVGRCEVVPATVEHRGEPLALEPLPLPPRERDALPTAFVVLDDELVDLRAAATAAARLGESWLFGIDRGEFDGGLFVLAPGAERPRRLTDEPVRAILDDGVGLVVLTGEDHLGAGRARVLALDLRADGTPALRHLFELPAVPRALAVTADHTLVVATEAGVIARSPDGTVTLSPCP
ncbi:MAG: hypothetical protein K1X88_04570 [Nannocystaceae bacterium]|nr:hypothetical protein [Nannocystaceae bacterium]